jgi:acyl carrier protein
MVRFRYDVVLTAGGPPQPGAECAWVDWTRGGLSVAELRARLTGERPEIVAVADVPNARVRPHSQIVRHLVGARGTVADLRRELAAEAVPEAVDPEELWRLDEQTGYRIDLDWSGHGPDGSFDLVARRRGGDGRPVVGPPRRVAPARQVQRWDGYVNGGQRRQARRLVPRLRAALGEKLPDYMIPSAFVFLDALPLTPNGKIDRNALPAPDHTRLELASAYVAPRNAVEAVMAGIWAEVLDIDRVGVFDDFFALGGHSLLSTRIIVRIRDAFQVDVPLRRIFSEPTVAGLSQVLLDTSGGREVVEKTAELLLTLSGMSDDQVAHALGGVPAADGARR